MQASQDSDSKGSKFEKKETKGQELFGENEDEND